MTMKICRVCFVEGDDLNNLGRGPNSCGYKLASCIPEIDVYIVRNSAICNTCLPMVDVAYKLRQMCIENENKFKIKKGHVISRKCAVKTTTENCKVSCEITKDEVRSETAEEQIRVSIILNNCFNESHVTQTGLKEKNEKQSKGDKEKNEKQSKGDKSQSVAGSKKHLWNENRGEVKLNEGSDDELINTLNDMCADINDFEEKPSKKLFSNNDNFELDLVPLNLLYPDETDKSEENCKEAASNNGSEQPYKVSEELKTTHMKKHGSPQCSETFSDICELKTKNLSNLKNICEICDEVFPSKNFLLKHKQKHITTCCGEEFLSGSLLQLHTYQKHGKSCGICKETLNSFNAIFLHLLKHMNKNKLHKKTFPENCKATNFIEQNRNTCQYCQSEFQNSSLLTEHLIKCHCKKVPNVRMVDYRKFISGLDLDESSLLKLQNSKVTAKFYCYACQKVYMNLNVYLKHMKMFHSSCTTCKKRFYDVTKVIDHVNLHFKKKTTTIRAYCERCKKKFINEQSYNIHMNKFHKILESETHNIEHNDSEAITSMNINLKKSISNPVPCRKCKVCGKVFRKIESLKKHINAVHNRCTIESATKGVSDDENVAMQNILNTNHCDICWEQFDAIDKLKQHVSVHI